MKSIAMAGLMAAAIFATSVISAQEPVQNIDPGRHPNLAAAQALSHQAWAKIVSAQQANEWDMSGHAQKARDLFVQANIELRLAAEAANRH